MGAIAQSLPGTRIRLAPLWDFLKHELTPYRGRTAVVARMVTASTLVMIVCMTFRIPNGALAAIFTLLISRESLQATARTAGMMAASGAVGGAYILFTATLVAGNPMLRFVWAGATFFLVFYALSAVRNYNAVAVFGVLCMFTIPLWDRQIPLEPKVEGTLWTVGVMALGSLVTVALELTFAAFRRTDQVTEALTLRLDAIEELLDGRARGDPAPDDLRSEFARLESVGTSGIRRMVYRAPYHTHHRQRLSAVLALTGRLVDLGADLARWRGTAGAADRSRLRQDAQYIAEIRNAVLRGTSLRPAPPPAEGEVSPALPLLAEIEKTIFLIRDVLAGAPLLARYLPVTPGASTSVAWLAPGSFSDPQHVRFALRGCLAAGLCYLIYNALFWPGLSISVVTCLLTALTTIGASRQKQFLRFAGAVIGGFVLGMGAQIFILPHLDSIAAFAVLFAAATAIAAWVATAGARLSYLGIQIALGFDLVHLQGFDFQTSLSAARDRALGVLLGLAMMWLAYDLLWSEPAAAAMKKSFAAAIRMLSELFREPRSEDRREAIARSLDLQERIDAQFNQVRSLADGVLFEFGPSRHEGLAWRERFRRWQPRLRTLLLMRLGALRYRMQLPGFELPESVRRWQRVYDQRTAVTMDALAHRIEGHGPAAASVGEESPVELPPEAPESFRALVQSIDRLTASLGAEIAREPQFPG